MILLKVICYVNVENHFLTFTKHKTFTRTMLGTPFPYFLFSSSLCILNDLFSGKKHYNEFYAVKMARQLMAENDDDDDAADDGAVDAAEKSKSCDSSHSPMDTGPESQI